MRKAMKASLLSLALPAILHFFAMPIAIASVRAIPLPELVKVSDAIITGRIIKTERTEIRDGVHEVVCHIRVDSVLKGEPKTNETVIAEKRLEIVQIQFWDGKQVPTGKTVYELGEEGIWFLTAIEKSKTGLYEASAHYNVSELDAVKKELQNQGVPATR
jgi:hypothetical protein